jgi:hypothetical protein
MTWRAAALLALVSCLAQSSSSAPPRVSFLKPIPRIVSSQDAVSFKVRIEPDPSARLLIVAALDVGGEVVRRSDEQLDRGSPRTRWVQWVGLPAGDLLVIAEIHDVQKAIGRASTPLCVTGAFETCASLFEPP